MTLDDRDRKVLEAIDHVGQATPHVLAFHPVIDLFETYEELELCIKGIANDGYLRTQTLPDVTGDSVTEYDTIVGWEERGEAADAVGHGR